MSERSAQQPDVDHWVIAHSHGGNIACYALAGEDAPSGINVITLATPFIALAERPRVLGLLALPVVAIAGSFGFDVLPGLAVGSIFLATFWIAALLVVGSIALSRATWSESTRRDVWPPWPTETEVARWTAVSPPSVRLTVIRARGDEASGFLGFFEVITYLSKRAIRLLDSTAFGMSLFLASGLWRLLPSTGDVRAGNEALEAMARLSIGTVFTIAALAVAIAVASSLAFGSDAAHWWLGCTASAEAAPIGASKIEVVPQAGARLAHSVYSQPNVIDGVLKLTRDR